MDYKTGKVRAEQVEEQLSLYALVALLLYEDLKEVVVQAWFLDHDQELVRHFKRKHIPKLKEYWEREVVRYFKDRDFVPNPGYYCRWCDFSKAKGGPCKF